MTKNEVYEAMRFQIISNVIQPGKILNEKDLMEQFGIGRTPLRDVLLKLEEEELIHTLPRHGHMVMPVDVSEVRELVELRRELEGFAGSLAAERVSQAQLEQMRAILQEAQHEIPERHSMPKISEYFDTRFHYILYEATKNRKLVKVLRGLHSVMFRIWFHIGLSTLDYSLLAQNLNSVLRELEQKDPQGARRAMEKHVELYAKKIREEFL
jgi:DNA-binding GntR family transcriptional regulator